MSAIFVNSFTRNNMYCNVLSGGNVKLKLILTKLTLIGLSTSYILIIDYLHISFHVVAKDAKPQMASLAPQKLSGLWSIYIS